MNRPYQGTIHDLRFVQLVDGRKILQFRDVEGWYTPQTIPQSELTQAEGDELFRSIEGGTL